MIMADVSPRFGLPFILPGQAQKELFHNEALLALDLAVHAAVEHEAPSSPPAAPEPGRCWIVPAGAGGAWEGRDGNLAGWTASGWRFVAPAEGMIVWDRGADLPLRYGPDGWNGGELSGSKLTIGGEQIVGPRLPAVPSPSGGTIIDAEARAAIDAIIATFMSHGLTG
jgi:hypothetical protein